MGGVRPQTMALQVAVGQLGRFSVPAVAKVYTVG